MDSDDQISNKYKINTNLYLNQKYCLFLPLYNCHKQNNESILVDDRIGMLNTISCEQYGHVSGPLYEGVLENRLYPHRD